MHAQREKLNFWKPLTLWHIHKSMRDDTVKCFGKKKKQNTGHIFRPERSYEIWDECSWPHSKNPDSLDRNGKIGKPVQEKSPIPNKLSQVKVKVNFLSVSLMEDVWQRATIRHLWAFKGENIFGGQGIVHSTQDSLLPLGFLRWHYLVTLHVQVQGWGSQSCGVRNFQHPEVEEQIPETSSCLFP